MNDLFVCSDGSRVRSKSAKWLSKLPIWNGNRLIDPDHVKNIKESLKGNVSQLNLNVFRIVVVPQEDDEPLMQIIDGQHRASILCEYFKDPKVEDFPVLVAAKQCINEDEIIEYFKVLNNTKSISWREDPVVRSNQYIDAIIKIFNTNPKRILVRSGKTTKPFISVDKLREYILSKHVLEWEETPIDFAERARQKNEELLNGLRLKDRYSLPSSEFRALEYRFALALDEKFNWI
jgi:hypothetical protein